MIRARRGHLLLTPSLGLLAFPSAALAHDFSSIATAGSVVAFLQALPLIWIARRRKRSFALWYLLAVLTSWLVAIAAVFGLQSMWPLLILGAPCATFLIVAKPDDRRSENAP